MARFGSHQCDVPMADVAIACADKDLEEGAPKPTPPKPDPRWIRARRLVSVPLKLLVRLIKYLWNLAFAKRPIQ